MKTFRIGETVFFLNGNGEVDKGAVRYKDSVVYTARGANGDKSLFHKDAFASFEEAKKSTRGLFVKESNRLTGELRFINTKIRILDNRKHF